MARKAGGHRCKRISAVGRQEDAEKCGNDALSSHCSRQLYPITPVPPPPPYRPDRVCARGPELRCGRSRSSRPRLSIYPLRSFIPSPLSPLIYRLPLIFQFRPCFFTLPPFPRTRSIVVHRFVAQDNRENFTRRRDIARLPRADSTGGCVERACRSSNPTRHIFFPTDFVSRACPRPTVYLFTILEHRKEGT